MSLDFFLIQSVFGSEFHSLGAFCFTIMGQADRHRHTLRFASLSGDILYQSRGKR